MFFKCIFGFTKGTMAHHTEDDTMGLDISAYRQMTKLNKFDLELDDDGHPVNGDALRFF